MVAHPRLGERVVQLHSLSVTVAQRFGRQGSIPWVGSEIRERSRTRCILWRLVSVKPLTGAVMKDRTKAICVCFVGLCLFLFMTAITGAIAAQPKENKVGIFASLDKGQKVSLKETAQGFEIGVFPGVEQLGYTITEIGQDYIVLEDITGVSETRIPVYSIKTIKTIKLPAKR